MADSPSEESKEPIVLLHDDGLWFFANHATGLNSQDFSSRDEALAALSSGTVEWSGVGDPEPFSPEEVRQILAAYQRAQEKAAES